MSNFKLDKLSNKCEKQCQLHNIMFVLLSACNQNCIHCYIPNHDNTGLSKEKICECIDEARRLGAIAVTFTGGEIFVRNDMMDIIKYARSRYLRVFLMSNGSCLTDEQLEELANLYISGFSTTIFSMDPKIHDQITQMPGSLNKTLHTIDKLDKNGIEITIKTPLMEINKNEFSKVKQYADDHGFLFKSTATIFSKLDGNNQSSLQIKDNLDCVVKEIDNLNNDSLAKRGKNPCSAGFNTICINYDGEVWPCNTLNLKIGNVYETSLTEIWNNSETLKEWRKKSKHKIKECCRCSLKRYCKRCPGLALMEDNNLYGCSSAAKRLAQVRYEYNKKGGGSQ